VILEKSRTSSRGSVRPVIQNSSFRCFFAHYALYYKHKFTQRRREICGELSRSSFSRFEVSGFLNIEYRTRNNECRSVLGPPRYSLVRCSVFIIHLYPGAWLSWFRAYGSVKRICNVDFASKLLPELSEFDHKSPIDFYLRGS
jgi:hypothetical protein